MSARIDPAELRQVALRLKPGVILRMYQPIAEKVKRHILIAAAADRSLAFIINTRPSPFVAARPEWMMRQLIMPRAEHMFMQHDSYIACHDTVGLPAAAELARLVCTGEGEILGTLSQKLMGSIVSAAAGSSLIADRDMRLIVAGFPPGRSV